MAEESEDDLENEPEVDPTDCEDHEEEPDAIANEIIEIKDVPIPRSHNLGRDHVGNRSASVFWSFFDITPLMTHVDRNGEEKINHLLKCNTGKCKYSTTDHKRNTSNSNMRKRLLTKHWQKDLERSATREELLGAVSKSVIIESSKKANDNSRKAKFTKSLLTLFGNNPIPFKMIETKDFEKSYLVNGISLPFKSHTTLSNKLRERGAIAEAEFKEALLSDQVISIHLQTDLWQSPSKKHFTSLIGTFIVESFAYSEVLLSFCEFGSQHTGQNIARAILAILEEYKITSKLTGITTDGVSNSINMMTELDNLYRNYRIEKGEDAFQELSVLFDADT
jgi:hypothetical protein